MPPSVPKCTIPQTVTTNKPATLSCHDPDSSPPPTYKWFKDGTLLPVDPNKISGFKNATYKLDSKSGTLVCYTHLPCIIRANLIFSFCGDACLINWPLWIQVFPSVTKKDTGMYYCEVVNEAGPAQSCRPGKMEVRKFLPTFIVVLI